jgi:calcineurin-like phosphoesterase family protein
METYFVSDTHFSHPNVLLYNRRPVLQQGDINREGRFVSKEVAMKRSQEMDERMIENWNNVVGKKDRVVIVGDFAFKNHARYANALNGKKTLVIGSHDKASKEVYGNCFTEVCQRKTMVINKQFFDINHCCLRVWEKSHYGSIHLFGHSHGRLNTFNLSFDVGVDVPENNYRPVHFNEIMRRAAVRTEEMKRTGRVVKQDDGKTMYYQDDLAYFCKGARNGTR